VGARIHGPARRHSRPDDADGTEAPGASCEAARALDLKLRTVFTGGEALPGETLQWLENELRIVCNEGYGMSEVNHMIGNCRRLRTIKPGSMGWEFPGHIAALIDEEGVPVPTARSAKSPPPRTIRRYSWLLASTGPDRRDATRQLDSHA
jgi:acyl-coenzyme A synthetase/AMP-(fatty) acid ligase